MDILGPEGEQARPAKRGWLIALAKFAVAAIILTILFRKGDIQWGQLGRALSRWDIALLILALTVLSYYGQAYRWVLLLRSRSIEISPWDAFRFLMIGKFFNLAVPGYFSEDFMRGLYLVQRGCKSRSLAVMSLVADRSIGILTMLLLVLGGVLLRPEMLSDARFSVPLGICLTGITGAVAGILILTWLPQPPAFVLRLASLLHLHMAVDKMYAEARHYARSLPLQAAAIGVTVINQGLMVWCFVLFGHRLGISNLTWVDYLVYVPLGMMATMLPVAPVGLGVGHVAFLTLFKLAGSKEGANLFSLYTAIVIVVSLCGGFFYLGNREKNKK